MEMDNDQFQKLVASLANLSEAELLQLEQRLWDMKMHRPIPTENKEVKFFAEVKFPIQPSEEKWSLDAIQEMIEHLNPAEIDVLYHSITLNLPKTRYRNVGQISAHWGTNGDIVTGGTMVGLAGPRSAPNPAQDAKFKEFSQLVEQAKVAKNSGDRKRASELVDKAIALGKQLNLSASLLERMRQLYT